MDAAGESQGRLTRVVVVSECVYRSGRNIYSSLIGGRGLDYHVVSLRLLHRFGLSLHDVTGVRHVCLAKRECETKHNTKGGPGGAVRREQGVVTERGGTDVCGCGFFKTCRLFPTKRRHSSGRNTIHRRRFILTDGSSTGVRNRKLEPSRTTSERFSQDKDKNTDHPFFN